MTIATSRARPIRLLSGFVLVLLSTVLVAILAGLRADACGPFAPELLAADEDAVLAAPVVPLFDALESLGLVTRLDPSQLSWGKPESRTAEADRMEVAEALLALDRPVEERRRLIRAHQEFRNAVVHHLDELRRWGWLVEGWWQAGPPPPPPRASLPAIPAGLPAEFELYLRGAASFHTNHLEDARATWRSLLELPPGDRRHRSVWASFMLGRTALGEDPEEAERWFLHTRELAEEGFSDVLALARDALGWLGRIELDRGRPARALALYARQAADGEDRQAIESLRGAAERLVRSAQTEPGQLDETAADPLARRALTAYLIAYPEDLAALPDWPSRWREAGEEPLAEATLHARAAYQGGRFDDARRWLEAAPEDDPMAVWLRGKLEVRDGRLDRAAGTLRRAAAVLPPDPTGFWTRRRDLSWGPMTVASAARAEAGVVALSRGRFEDALDLFLEAGVQLDAIYVAERVLTADELERWVDRRVPLFTGDRRSGWNLPLDLQLRWVLARRLVRLDRIEEALRYFDPVRPLDSRLTLEALAERLREALVCGRGEAVGEECHGADRADGYWQAALLTRHNGPELRGSALGPDWITLGGQIYFGDSADWARERRGLKYLPATEEELDRVARHGVDPRRRWHYRYAAAELAWQAARLVPDGTDRKATILATAGRWLANRDPEAADRFYKALVRCCRNTELGRSADELRWFPPLGETR